MVLRDRPVGLADWHFVQQCPPLIVCFANDCRAVSAGEHSKIPCRPLHISPTKSVRATCSHGAILNENLAGYRVTSQRKSTHSWEVLVPRRGLEPPRPLGHWYLKPARLPIPPSGHRCRRARFKLRRLGCQTVSGILRMLWRGAANCRLVPLMGWR